MAGELSKEELVDGVRCLGVRAGDTVLVHSAMRTLGRVAGGAATVVAAFLEVLGETGTLVAPTFCFYNEAVLGRGEVPLIDPAADQTEMGAIAEHVRTLPGAKRSLAFRHSFAAVGRRAELITDVDPSLSSFDLRSAFGVMLALDTRIVMLGLNCTALLHMHPPPAPPSLSVAHPRPQRLAFDQTPTAPPVTSPSSCWRYRTATRWR